MRHDFGYCCPAFNDPQKQPAILKELADYVQKMGYHPSEFAGMKDRRHMLMAWKALQFDKLHRSMTQGN